MNDRTKKKENKNETTTTKLKEVFDVHRKIDHARHIFVVHYCVQTVLIDFDAIKIACFFFFWIPISYQHINFKAFYSLYLFTVYEMFLNDFLSTIK